MANKDGHRRFGNIRELPSGRHQIRYPGPDGRMRNGTRTYARKSDADRALTLVESQILTGEWTDPELARVRLKDYAAKWITQRPNLRPRTVGRYKSLLRHHIVPSIGDAELGRISTDMVRTWRAELLEKGTSVSVAAKAYRLLRAVLMTAAEDRIIPRNPCKIKGAGDEHPEERPVLTVEQVFQLADRIGRRPVGNIRKLANGRFQLRYMGADGGRRTAPVTYDTREDAEWTLWSMTDDGEVATVHDDRFRAMILMATFASLRWGEVIALRRRDIDVKRVTVTVRETVVELDSGELITGPPKSAAGRRIVSFPTAILPDVMRHLDRYVGDSASALVFTGSRGGMLRRANFRRSADWARAVDALGVPELHFHDLRHTGNTFAADTGASTKNLMGRMGHATARAALIYQHRTRAADQAIADALSDQLEQARPDSDDADGAAGVPERAG
jgi:integrase